jgi:hypothetical protein
MSRLWRGLAAITLTTGLAATTMPLAALASAAPSAVTVTIAAKSLIPHVTGDTLVVFKVAKFNTATIHGTVTGAAPGDEAILLAQTFPFKHAAVPVGSPVLLSASPMTYSFEAAPSLATRYQVEVKTAGPAGTQVGKSAVQVVYVTAFGRFTNAKPCARPVCTQRLRFTATFPSSALKRESAKHVFFYFGVNENPRKIPRAPKHLLLDTHAKITKLGRRSSTRFEWRITWSFRIGRNAYRFLPNVCTRDTESKDGVGLPGHHQCGNKRISTKVVYLG